VLKNKQFEYHFEKMTITVGFTFRKITCGHSYSSGYLYSSLLV